MFTEEQLKSTWDSIKSIEGTKISMPKAVKSLHIAQESKKGAGEYKWLYHCTTIYALMSIIKNREMRLSNLRLVNDEEEAGRIDAQEYETAFYVACFTHSDIISNQHWEEYSSLTDGVLVGFKREWIERKAVFVLGSNEKDDNIHFTIFKNHENALKEKLNQQVNHNRIIQPYFIMDFGFYKVVYDDVLKADIQGEGVWEYQGMSYPGRTLIPRAAGIVKNKQGLCEREGKEPYVKDWSEENEVRLKICIVPFLNDEKQPFFFPKIAVPLTASAFSELRIQFSPNFDEKRKEESLVEIKNLLSGGTV